MRGVGGSSVVGVVPALAHFVSSPVIWVLLQVEVEVFIDALEIDVIEGGIPNVPPSCICLTTSTKIVA